MQGQLHQERKKNETKKRRVDGEERRSCKTTEELRNRQELGLGIFGASMVDSKAGGILQMASQRRELLFSLSLKVCDSCLNPSGEFCMALQLCGFLESPWLLSLPCKL